ncbi:MAG TPA: glutathione S-transferase N-terminal domain-containing protein [Steroidobacteraceae bacterium]|jgi:glutathione S-transferase|nr:glutathione S-transferase N-terminal domain-containing protein [Steroidobacteraceae bacterium]
MSNIQIFGRSSSLFTRMPLIFAEELSVPYQLVPIYDMTALEAEAYAGNPALKLPILRTNGIAIFGAQNICRALADRTPSTKRIVWPETLRDDLSRNAQELVWHCMATQVQIVFGTMVNKLPGDNLYFVKARESFAGSLRWLDANLSNALKSLPLRDMSLFEVSLHCLIEHLTFRGTLSVEPYPSLVGFSKNFATRPSAQRTAFRFDVPA